MDQISDPKQCITISKLRQTRSHILETKQGNVFSVWSVYKKIALSISWVKMRLISSLDAKLIKCCAWNTINSIDQHFNIYIYIHCIELSRKGMEQHMMTSSNGNIFRVTGHLCGEFTGPRWIPHTKASDAELWCFFALRLNKRLSKQSWGWWLETLSHPLWRHRNETHHRCLFRAFD